MLQNKYYTEYGIKFNPFEDTAHTYAGKFKSYSGILKLDSYTFLLQIY